MCVSHTHTPVCVGCSVRYLLDWSFEQTHRDGVSDAALRQTLLRVTVIVGGDA